MEPLKIAFVGMGQHYASHVWMRRMHELLADQIVVSIDDCRNTRYSQRALTTIQLVPRKMSRVMRLIKLLGLTTRTHASTRSEWMLRVISRSGANCVLVHFLDYAVQFADVWKKLDLPVVVHCHGYDITWQLKHFETAEPVHPPDYTDQVLALGNNVSFIANSTFTQQRLTKIGVEASRAPIKRFGVPVSSEPPTFDSACKTILYLGRLASFKGPVETVRAFDRVAGKHNACRLELAGDGPLALEVDQAIDACLHRSMIHRHGAVDVAQGDKLRSRSAVFTAHNQVGKLTGQQEAFGVSLIEAMANGLPVVTGRSGGLVDFVRHEENGMLFDSGDVSGHADMLDELLSNWLKRQKLGLAAWETVRENYQIENEREDLLRILDEAVNGTRQAHRIAA
ncbi:MAG: glycosyltransferase [Planctomycetota bacterium]